MDAAAAMHLLRCVALVMVLVTWKVVDLSFCPLVVPFFARVSLFSLIAKFAAAGR